MLVIYAKYKENRMEIDGVSKPLFDIKKVANWGSSWFKACYSKTFVVCAWIPFYINPFICCCWLFMFFFVLPILHVVWSRENPFFWSISKTRGDNIVPCCLNIKIFEAKCQSAFCWCNWRHPISRVFKIKGMLLIINSSRISWTIDIE